MDKPIYLLPFIFVYKFFKYIAYGFIYSFILLYSYSGKFIRYLVYGLIVISYWLYKFFKYFVYGIYFPIVFISDKIGISKAKNSREQRRISKERKKIDKRLAKSISNSSLCN